MSARPVACPKCGAKTQGKFCGQCGSRIRAECPSCGTEAPPGSRFCQECGSPLARFPRNKAEAKGPWLALGAAGVVLAVVGGFIILDRRERAERAASPPAPSSRSQSPPAVGAASPQETAELLFNRTMAASERGDVAEAQRFAPRALEAYRRLGVRDNDGHYHVGLIHLTMGDVESARAELEAIRRAEPDHLLGIMLEHAVAEAEGDVDGVARAYSRFLAVYEAEMRLDRPEYRDHERGIDGFRARASATAASQ